MLKTTGIDPLVIDLVVGKNSYINRVSNSEVNKTNVGTKTTKSKSQDKSKGKNLLKSFSAKSQAFI